VQQHPPNQDQEYIYTYISSLPPPKLTNLLPDKDTWINNERLRWATLFSIPMATSLPPAFPAPTLPVGRALAVLQPSQQKLAQALDALFKAHWADGKAIHEGEVLRGVLEGALGREETGRVLAEMGTSGKQRLIENTDRAFNEGAFGLPWIVCTDREGKTEGFWGVDHMGQVVEFLGLDRSKGFGKAGWRAVL